MAKSNKHKKNNSELGEQKKSDVYIDEETIEIEESVEHKEVKEEKHRKDNSEENKELSLTSENTAIDAIVEEYNGDIKKEHSAENQIKIRESAEVAKMKKRTKKFVIILISVILAILIAFVAVAIVNKMNDNVYRNIYLSSKNISGMTNLELTDYLKQEQEVLSKTSLKVFQENEEILEIVPSDINFEIDIAAVEKQIFGFGRESNVLKNNIDILYALIAKKEYDLVYKYDVNKLSEIVKEIKESLDNKVIQDSYVVNENEYKLIITRGKSGNSIDEEVVKNKIVYALSNSMGEYKVDTILEKPSSLDVDVVYSKVKREAKDAYIDKTSTVYKFVPHQVGLDFDKSDLKAVLSKEENTGEEKVIEYSLTVIQPEVKTSDIKWEVYEYKISSYTTYFSTSDANRVNNLRVALNLLNGKVIMPGETFSYNSVVGGATAAQGFKPAATFVGGRITSEVGGGICQTVSTLYNTALLANLEIVQRKAHSLPVAYVPGSRDATVYYPSIDFKFKNTREYPIKIVTSFNKNGNLTISLYGTKEQNEYVVSISSKKTETIPYTTQYINDSSLPKGQQVVTQNGSNGYKSEAYITKKLNGKVVSTTLLSRDTYKAVAKIVRVGTKVVATSNNQNSTNINTNVNININNTNNSGNISAGSTTPSTGSVNTTPSNGTENTGNTENINIGAQGE